MPTHRKAPPHHRPVSPTLRELLALREGLAKRRRVWEEERRQRLLAEADAKRAYEKAKAEAYLRHPDGTVAERTSRATLDIMEEFAELHEAVALRRSADGAGRTLEKEYEALTAMIHAYNREIRSEMDLAQTGSG